MVPPFEGGYIADDRYPQASPVRAPRQTGTVGDVAGFESGERSDADVVVQRIIMIFAEIAAIGAAEVTAQARIA